MGRTGFGPAGKCPGLSGVGVRVGHFHPSKKFVRILVWPILGENLSGQPTFESLLDRKELQRSKSIICSIWK
jgi:hypothetical protein